MSLSHHDRICTLSFFPPLHLSSLLQTTRDSPAWVPNPGIAPPQSLGPYSSYSLPHLAFTQKTSAHTWSSAPWSPVCRSSSLCSLPYPARVRGLLGLGLLSVVTGARTPFSSYTASLPTIHGSLWFGREHRFRCPTEVMPPCFPGLACVALICPGVTEKVNSFFRVLSRLPLAQYQATLRWHPLQALPLSPGLP